jgi:hypothetical protein
MMYVHTLCTALQAALRSFAVDCQPCSEGFAELLAKFAVRTLIMLSEVAHRADFVAAAAAQPKPTGLQMWSLA